MYFFMKQSTFNSRTDAKVKALLRFGFAIVPSVSQYHYVVCLSRDVIPSQVFRYLTNMRDVWYFVECRDGKPCIFLCANKDL